MKILTPQIHDTFRDGWIIGGHAIEGVGRMVESTRLPFFREIGSTMRRMGEASSRSAIEMCARDRDGALRSCKEVRR